MTRLITRIVGASIGLFATLAWSSPSLADESSSSAPETPADTPPPAAPAPATGAVASTGAVVPSHAAVANGAVVTRVAPQPYPKEGGRNHVRTGASLLLTGMVTFGLSYAPAAYVASDSQLPADRKLQIPFAGPWLDLMNRPGCGMPGVNCGNESGYTALLLIDSFFQALSAVEALAGLIELGQEDPAPRAPKSDEATLHLAPAALGATSYGLSAFGKF
jgi:hypothetical protein